MEVKEAKRIAALEKVLIQKFKHAGEEQAKVQAKRRRLEDNAEPTPVNEALLSIPTTPLLQPDESTIEKKLTVDKAKQVETMKSKLMQDFANIQAKELAERKANERKFEVITKTIREEKEATKKAAEVAKQARFKQMARFRPRISSTPSGKFNMAHHDSDNEPDKLEIENHSGAASSEQQPLNQSMKKLLDTKMITLGIVGARYLPKAKDDKFGIYYDDLSERPMIGCEEITFDGDDIIFVKDKKTYKGSEGLWRLLTDKDPIETNKFTQSDWTAYKEILGRTHSLYHRNDPLSGKPKSSRGRKWLEMVKPVWEAHSKNINGSGLAVYETGRPLEYRYIKHLNELVTRLNYIYAQEIAGNNSFHNEKLSIVRFLADRIEELVEKPNGIKYIVRVLSSLPENMIEGSGLLNDLINKLPFELHAPSNWKFDKYNYCGPGTKLDKRLKAGDKGINPLDDECMRHDLYYRDHEKTEDRWVADKELQKAAWKRVKSSDADVNERLVGLATMGTMWAKRKLGMGLGTSGYIFS